MKHRIFYAYIVALFSFSQLLHAQCDIPQPFTANTGSNMTILLTGSFLQSISINNDDAYIVAILDDGMVVGTVYFNDPNGGVGLSQGQGTIAIWGDDTDSPEKDGASTGDNISFQLVDGGTVYDLSSPATTYSTNSFLPFSNASDVSDSCEVPTCDVWFPEYNGGPTGSNMTVLFQNDAVNDLPEVTEGAYIVAVANSGLVIGSTILDESSQIDVPIWGDDVSTSDIIEAALNDEAFSFYIINTDEVFSLDVEINSVGSSTLVTEYAMNGTIAIAGLSYSNYCNPLLPLGCTDSVAFNYNSLANTDDGSCEAIVNGCTDSQAFNYNSLANTDNGSCLAVVNGCTDSVAFNYNSLANTDDGSCLDVVNGCTDSEAFNYNSLANTNDDSCIEVVNGCIDSGAFNYDSLANTDDGSCIPVVIGCLDELACTYDISHNTSDSELCEYPDTYFNCDGNCINDSDFDGVCNELEVFGCVDSTACDGFNPFATDDDESCLFFDECGVCDGANDCALFISNNVTVSIVDNFDQDPQAIEVFEDSFEDLMETQLGLPDGSVEVIDIIVSRGDVHVFYTIY